MPDTHGEGSLRSMQFHNSSGMSGDQMGQLRRLEGPNAVSVSVEAMSQLEALAAKVLAEPQGHVSRSSSAAPGKAGRPKSTPPGASGTSPVVDLDKSMARLRAVTWQPNGISRSDVPARVDAPASTAPQPIPAAALKLPSNFDTRLRTGQFRTEAEANQAGPAARWLKKHWGKVLVAGTGLAALIAVASTSLAPHSANAVHQAPVKDLKKNSLATAAPKPAIAQTSAEASQMPKFDTSGLGKMSLVPPSYMSPVTSVGGVQVNLGITSHAAPDAPVQELAAAKLKAAPPIRLTNSLTAKTISVYVPPVEASPAVTQTLSSATLKAPPAVQSVLSLHAKIGPLHPTVEHRGHHHVSKTGHHHKGHSNKHHHHKRHGHRHHKGYAFHGSHGVHVIHLPAKHFGHVATHAAPPVASQVGSAPDAATAAILAQLKKASDAAIRQAGRHAAKPVSLIADPAHRLPVSFNLPPDRPSQGLFQRLKMFATRPITMLATLLTGRDATFASVGPARSVGAPPADRQVLTLAEQLPRYRETLGPAAPTLLDRLPADRRKALAGLSV